jgi:hypothetical protein
MSRTFFVAICGGAFFAVVAHCVAGALRSDLEDWPALIGGAAGALVGAVAGAAERVVQAIDAQTDRLAGATENRQRPARPPADGQPATGIQSSVPERASS